MLLLVFESNVTQGATSDYTFLSSSKLYVLKRLCLECES